MVTFFIAQRQIILDNVTILIYTDIGNVVISLQFMRTNGFR